MLHYDLLLLLGASLGAILISERYNKPFFVLIFSLLAVLQVFLCFTVSVSSFLITFFLYIPVGILYSFWKYKNYAKMVVNELKEIDDQYRRKTIIEKFHPKKMVSLILVWILIWPISVINTIISAIISCTTSLVTHTFYQVYNRIHEQAIKESTYNSVTIDKEEECNGQ